MCILFSFSRCATIIGGSKYNANVIVRNHPQASIQHNGVSYGYGIASIKLPRNKASELTFVVKEEGCEEQTFTYSSKVIRGWALVGSLLFWTGTPPLPIPYGGILDFATGAVYKPDVKEPSITKNDYNSFNYALDYTGCGEIRTNTPKNKDSNLRSIEERLIALKALYKDGLITKEEYESQKKKILEEL